MKLLTLNCHGWMEENQLHKLHVIAKKIVEEKYDVIALQEVNQLIESELSSNIIKEDNYALVLIKKIKELGGEEYQMFWDYSHIGFDKFEEGVCIITKHRVNSSRSFYVTDSKAKDFWKSRNIIECTVSINGKDINFYSCHLGWWNDGVEPFQKQIDNLINKLDNNSLSILMGDFNNNAFIKNEGYDYLLNKGLYDTYTLAKEKDSGVTVKGKIAGWDENTVPLRLDWIVTNEKLPIKYSKVVFNGKNEEIVSDHYGVEVLINS